MTAPIKTCDCCGATGEMPTFMNGETICYTCLHVLPKTLPEARQELMRLRAVLAVVVQPTANFVDAYQGAMEEVAIWKKRALEAEDLNRKFVAEINGPTYMGEPAQPAPSVPDTYAAGINAVAAMLQSKAAEYAKEYGHDDMGGLSFGSGMGGEIKMDYYTNLIELIDDVRAMLAGAPEAKP